MSRERHRRRRSSRPREQRYAAAHSTRALLLIGGFVIGALLEWLRSQPRSAHWGWQSDTLATLLAAWMAVALLLWWPDRGERRLPFAAGLMLAMLFLGTLVMHELINHGA
jgi:cytochrome bd-type quinol oxidase subunit 2